MHSRGHWLGQILRFGTKSWVERRPSRRRQPQIANLEALEHLSLERLKARALLATTAYVAPFGNDTTGDGSSEHPWASITKAAQAIPDDGGQVVVLDGTYGPQIIERSFSLPLTIHAENPYRAVLSSTTTAHRALMLYGAANVTLDGFEIKGQPGGTDDYLIQVTTSATHDIVLQNNIIHDSYSNDILKINDLAYNITVRGNVFYNQPPVPGDEHIDINTVHDVTVEDNIFFNDYAASGRPVVDGAQSFIVIKNSDSSHPGVTQNITVRRNEFLNYHGASDQPYLLLGEDGQPFYEVDGALIENNLFLGNDGVPMSGAIALKGVKNVTIRANTVNGDLPLGSTSWGFAVRLGREGSNPPNENIAIDNNIWSDPTGRMTSLFGGNPADTINATLRNNVYFNGGKPIPFDATRVLNYTDDPAAILGDPGLPSDLSKVVPPSWSAANGRFADGSATIRDAFVNLVTSYGTPSGVASAAIGAADPTRMPVDDILGRPRGPRPDVGAVEATSVTQQPPVAANDSYTTPQNTTLTVAAPGVLANDSDPSGKPLTAALVAGPANGTLTLNSNGSFSYTPKAGFYGADSFTYRDSDGTLQSNTATVALTVTTPTSTGTTIFGTTATPTRQDDGPDSPVEVGVRFTSDVAGTITGIRFYKSSTNTGTHVGNLWDSNGTLLASATFTGETASGWQQVSFATPVAIQANTVYVASYHTNVGHYAEDNGYFTTAHSNGSLHALADGASGPNGVYRYGSGSGFPTTGYLKSNYWVDVVFVPG